MFFCLVTSVGQRKNYESHEESNLRPSDSDEILMLYHWAIETLRWVRSQLLFHCENGLDSILILVPVIPLVFMLTSRLFLRWNKSCCACICTCTSGCVASENQALYKVSMSFHLMGSKPSERNKIYIWSMYEGYIYEGYDPIHPVNVQSTSPWRVWS